MTSVERVMTYTRIDSEPGYSNETRPPECWPVEGSLVLQDLSLVYFEGGPRILKDINFCVSSKEKVGVVGRTGAGKSSLVSALFRMPDPLGKVSKTLFHWTGATVKVFWRSELTFSHFVTVFNITTRIFSLQRHDPSEFVIVVYDVSKLSTRSKK